MPIVSGLVAPRSRHQSLVLRPRHLQLRLPLPGGEGAQAHGGRGRLELAGDFFFVSRQKWSLRVCFHCHILSWMEQTSCLRLSERTFFGK